MSDGPGLSPLKVCVSPVSAFHRVPILHIQAGPVSVPSSRDPCSQLLVTEPAKACPQSRLETLRGVSMPLGFLEEVEV